MQAEQAVKKAYSIQHVNFTKDSIEIVLWESDLKFRSRLHGNGYHWFMVYPDGSEAMISRADVNDVFSHYNLVDGINILWHQSYENVQRELDKHRASMEKAEKALDKKYHRIINKLLAQNNALIEIPEAIKEVTDIKKLHAEYVEAIVYFLLHNNKVVYVGQTRSEWPGRIREHLKTDKNFDQVYYIQVRRHEVDSLERYYIKKFKPKYNKAHI